MRRLLWLSVGIGAGAVAVRKVGRAAQAYTPAGLARGLGGLSDQAREFADNVRGHMLVREAELYAAIEGDQAASVLSDGRAQPAPEPESSDSDRPSNPGRRRRT
ncbi:MAG: DUF6167 family protein [Angustibacter sp.]